MSDSKFNRMFALYIFCAEYHGGQWSRLYRIMSRISKQYDPRIPDSAWEAISEGTGRGAEEWEEARDIYLALVEKHGKEI